MGIEKSVEIAQARERRAKLLEEFSICETTLRRFAVKKNMSPQRMSQLLKMARDENV